MMYSGFEMVPCDCETFLGNHSGEVPRDCREETQGLLDLLERLGCGSDAWRAELTHASLQVGQLLSLAVGYYP